jgi:hypothetical protein
MRVSSSPGISPILRHLEPPVAGHLVLLNMQLSCADANFTEL